MLQRSLVDEPEPAIRAVAGPQLLMLAAPAARLPWVDGVQYVAPSTVAPSLWLPTTLEPDVAIDLLASALVSRYRAQPLLLLAEPALVVPLAGLLPVDAGWLQRLHDCGAAP